MKGHGGIITIVRPHINASIKLCTRSALKIENSNFFLITKVTKLYVHSCNQLKVQLILTRNVKLSEEINSEIEHR